MASGPNKRITVAHLTADRENLVTLQSLTDYSPRNLAYNTASLQQLEAALSLAEEAELVARRAYEVAREQAVQAGIAFHSGMQGAKVEVTAQYGADSPAVHAIGRKQKSERRRPARRVLVER